MKFCSAYLLTTPPLTGPAAQYADHDPITLWWNKVGPKNNPQETYGYHYLPFCKPHVRGI